MGMQNLIEYAPQGFLQLQLQDATNKQEYYKKAINRFLAVSITPANMQVKWTNELVLQSQLAIAKQIQLLI